MKMRLSEVRIRRMSLMGISNKKLPNRLAYAIAKNLMKLQDEDDLIEKRRVSIAECYAEKDELGNAVIEKGAYKFTDENKKIFSEEFEEFVTTETDVDVYKVSSDVFELLEDARFDALTPAEMVALDFMINCDNCTGTTEV